MRMLLAVLVLVAGCGINPCKKGTILLNVAAPGATRLRIDVSVAESTHTSTVSTNGGGGGSVEIDFNRYPSGQAVEIVVTALAADGTELGSNVTTLIAMAGCSVGSISVAGGGGSDDLGGGGNGSDLVCIPTLTACPATVACGKIDDGCGHTLDCGACQVDAVSPAIATTGDTIMLEGTFGQTVAVDFGGGTTVVGTVLGAHRASVVVPASGDGSVISIATGGSTVGTLAFRRANFALGVGAFSAFFEQENVARRTALDVGRSQFAEAIIGPYVYLIGGNVTIGPGSSGAVTTVSRATVNADGTLSEFANLPSVALTSKRNQASAVVIGTTLYVIGGVSGTILGSVERASIDPSGNISSFITLPSTGAGAVALSQPRYGFTTVIIGNFVYVIGGTTATGPERTIERATISASGTLSTFTVLPNTGADASQLAVGRSGAGVIVVGSKLYALGGSTASGKTNSADVATINADGTLSNFQTAPTSGIGAVALGGARDLFAFAQIGHIVVAVGGFDSGSAAVKTVETTTVGTGDALGVFAPLANSLRTARGSAGALISGNRLYVVGGNSGFTDGDLTIVEGSNVNASGAISTFTALPSSGPNALALPAPRMGYAAVTLGPYLYLLGGYETNIVNSVLRATIQPDGLLSAFSKLPTTGANAVVLVAGRQNMGIAVLGSWLYAIGGDGGAADPLTSVERAAVNPDGTISTFATVSGVTVKQPRMFFSTAALGTTLYLLGGQAGSSNANVALSSIESAAISSDGSIGTFNAAANMTSARFGHRTAALGGYFYAIGGDGNTGSVERAPISGGGLGAFVALPTSGTSGVAQSTPRTFYGLDVTGPTVLEIGGLGVALVPTIDSATLAADGTISTFAALPTVGNGAAVIAVPVDAMSSVSLGNRVWIFGGNGNGGPTSIVQNASLQ